MDLLTDNFPSGGDIEIVSLTNSHTTLVIAGPKSRALLQAVAPRADWSRTDFPWLSARRCRVGSVEVVAMSLSYSGELAYELHIPNSGLHTAYEHLVNIGREFNLMHFGGYAIESMRLEKGYPHWKAELITEFNPIEAGLRRFVDMNKDFPGKSGLERQVAKGCRRKLSTLLIDSDRVPAQPGETVFHGGKPVGTITSAGWGHRIDRNLAMAYIDPTCADAGTKLDVSLLGQSVCAEVSERCQYDPMNAIPSGS